MTKRQQWRERIALHCIKHGISGVDLAVTLDHAERFIFQDELIVPYHSTEQKQAIISAIENIIPNFDELTRFKRLIKQSG